MHQFNDVFFESRKERKTWWLKFYFSSSQYPQQGEKCRQVAQLHGKIHWKTQTWNINDIKTCFPVVLKSDHHFRMSTRGTVYCLHTHFFQVLNEVTQDVEWYIKHEGPCLTTYPNQPRRELKIRRVAEYFWRILRCSELWWDTVLSVWYIFSIETKTKE